MLAEKLPSKNHEEIVNENIPNNLYINDSNTKDEININNIAKIVKRDHSKFDNPSPSNTESTTQKKDIKHTGPLSKINSIDIPETNAPNLFIEKETPTTSGVDRTPAWFNRINEEASFSGRNYPLKSSMKDGGSGRNNTPGNKNTPSNMSSKNQTTNFSSLVNRARYLNNYEQASPEKINKRKRQQPINDDAQIKEDEDEQDNNDNEPLNNLNINLNFNNTQPNQNKGFTKAMEEYSLSNAHEEDSINIFNVKKPKPCASSSNNNLKSSNSYINRSSNNSSNSNNNMCVNMNVNIDYGNMNSINNMKLGSSNNMNMTIPNNDSIIDQSDTMFNSLYLNSIIDNSSKGYGQNGSKQKMNNQYQQRTIHQGMGMGMPMDIGMEMEGFEQQFDMQMKMSGMNNQRGYNNMMYDNRNMNMNQQGNQMGMNINMPEYYMNNYPNDFNLQQQQNHPLFSNPFTNQGNNFGYPQNQNTGYPYMRQQPYQPSQIMPQEYQQQQQSQLPYSNQQLTYQQPFPNQKKRSKLIPQNINNLSIEELIKNSNNLCKDQSGCRLLQKKLNENPSIADNLIRNAFENVIEIIKDPFGNYLIQKLFNYMSQDQLCQLMALIQISIYQICSNSYGTRVIQALIDYLQNDILLKTFFNLLKPIIKDMILDINASHILVKLIEMKNPMSSKLIIDEICSNIISIASHKHGCCVLQKFIEKTQLKLKQQLITCLIQNCPMLIIDQCGNYIIQYIIQFKDESINEGIVNYLVTDIYNLSNQKFSSNVVEKCFEYCSDNLCNKLLSALKNKDSCVNLLLDKYGNYVIQKALNRADAGMQKFILDSVAPSLYKLKNYAFGMKLYTKLIITYPYLSTIVLSKNDDYQSDSYVMNHRNGMNSGEDDI